MGQEKRNIEAIMIIQLNPPLPMETNKGSGVAHFLIDYSCEHDLFWVVFLDENGECWTINNKDVRACKNITLGRIIEKRVNADENQNK